MSNHQGKSCLPLIRTWLRAANYEPSAIGLAKLRTDRDKATPSHSILQHAVYEKRFIQRRTAERIIELFPEVVRAANDSICDFDSYIEGFGPLLNQLRSRRDHAADQENVWETLSIASNFSVSVLKSIEKGKLVPVAVCQRVIAATQGAFSTPVGGLRIKQALHNDMMRTPLPLACGRTDVLDRLYPDRG